MTLIIEKTNMIILLGINGELMKLMYLNFTQQTYLMIYEPLFLFHKNLIIVDYLPKTNHTVIVKNIPAISLRF